MKIMGSYILGLVVASSWIGSAWAQAGAASTPEEVSAVFDQAYEVYKKPKLRKKGLFGGGEAPSKSYEVLPIPRYRSKDITMEDRPAEISAPSASAAIIKEFPTDSGVAEVLIQFELDSATIRSDQSPLLQRIVEFARKHQDVPLQINGHTDRKTGTHEYNMTLSQKRAAAVRDYLVDVGGLDPRNLSGHGFGPNNPLTDESTPELIARNRRVEFRLE